MRRLSMHPSFAVTLPLLLVPPMVSLTLPVVAVIRENSKIWGPRSCIRKIFELFLKNYPNMLTSGRDSDYSVANGLISGAKQSRRYRRVPPPY
jgi:hypothetical protein